MLNIAVEKLKNGDLIGMPTETVYGLAADARNSIAVAKIFALKGRPHFNPLIAHVQNLEVAMREVEFNPFALKLAHIFWPGPLTLVLPVQQNSCICELARAGLPTLAIRVPNHLVALELLKSCGFPIVAPSANVSGRLSPTTQHAVRSEFGDDLPLILDGGNCHIGLESTIIGFDESNVPVLYRAGFITREEIENCLGMPIQTQMHCETPNSPPCSTPNSPGQLLQHYAPNTPMVLNALSANEDDAYLGFGAVPNTIHSKFMLNLSFDANLIEAASHLFEYLRILDGKNAARICVAPIPNVGLGEAINDRLQRGASKSL